MLSPVKAPPCVPHREMWSQAVLLAICAWLGAATDASATATEQTTGARAKSRSSGWSMWSWRVARPGDQIYHCSCRQRCKHPCFVQMLRGDSIVEWLQSRSSRACCEHSKPLSSMFPHILSAHVALWYTTHIVSRLSTSVFEHLSIGQNHNSPTQ